MNSKLNRFIKSLILEYSTDENDKKRIREMYHTNEFYLKFISTLAEECNVVATKQRENCFLVTGLLKNVEQFFNKLKVDSDFMDNPSDFKIYSPMFSYGETIHNLKYDEDYPVYEQPGVATQTHQIDNIVRHTVYGKWYNFFDETMNKKIKAIKPNEITKYFKTMFPKATKKFNENTDIFVEFQVNCENWKNQIFDEMSEYAKTPDEMNDFHNEDPIDFDYSQLNIKDK